MHPVLAKRVLQIGIAVGGIVPVMAGLSGVVLGPAMVEHAASSISLDSHYRYLSGLLFGIGCAFWSTIPNIENKGTRFRLLTAIVFVGGVGRALSLLAIGMPDPPMLFGLAMELGITPFFAFLQYRLSRKMAR